MKMARLSEHDFDAPDPPHAPPGDEGQQPAARGPRGGKLGPLGRAGGRKVARGTIAVLPTMFTLANVLCGFASIFLASQRWRMADQSLPFGWTGFTFAAIFIFIGMLMDGLDGRVARLTRSSSELGEQLDSMADMVTFGVAPAFLALQLAGVEAPFIADGADAGYFDRIGMVVACIYIVCAALRLARFNIESGEEDYPQHDSFKGLPSPGAAGTVASLVLLHQHFLANFPAHHWSLHWAAVAMVSVTALAALGMVSTFRYAHLMNRYVRGKAPFETVAKAVVLALLMLLHLQGALALAFAGYALSAPATWAYQKLTGRFVSDDSGDQDDQWEMEP
jgi:CDP-diacylglycerol--serine O-phosphatidyltransferase